MFYEKNKKGTVIITLITMVAILTVGVSAYQIAFKTDSLSTASGTATIRGGLYTYPSTSTPYNADTMTTLPIGPGRTTQIMARVLHSTPATENRTGYTTVNAYGSVAASTHEAYSVIDEVIFDEVFIDLP